MKNKILYIHPAVRAYRVDIFELLSKKLNVDFFWSSGFKSGSHMTHRNEEIERVLENTDFRYVQAKELNSLPIDNFSWELFKLPFKGYKVYIFSNITSVPYLLLSPFLRLFGKKIILFDELWRYPIEIRKYYKIYPYVKFLSQYCLDGVVVAGSKAKEFYLKKLNVDSSKIFVAFNTTIDTKEFVSDLSLNLQTKDKLDTLTINKRLLYLGRIVKYKGLDVLINSMINISTEYDLLVVGDGDFKSECMDLVKNNGLENRVFFLSGCLSNEAPYFYKNCDIFVLPTRFRLQDNVQIESWGFTVNEAMALERPVVATSAVGSGYDLILDEITGGLADAGDVNSLAQKINFIAKNNTNNKMGKKARSHLMNVCDNNKNIVIYQMAIQKALDEK
jgi:glycosyltransferase involved in cell wall biosynthesis